MSFLDPCEIEADSLTRRLLTALALVTAGLLALSLAGFVLAVRPPRLAVPLTPEQLGLRPEAVRIPAADGVTLAGWLLPRPGRPGVVLLHGYPADKRDLLPLAAALAPHFTVLLMDLRFFGDSGGRVTTLGHRERDDLARAVRWLEARGAAPVGVFGLSLGGAVALLAAAEEPGIRAVAAYAPFADLRLLAHDVYGYLWLLRYPPVGLMRLWSRLFLGADITRPAPAEAAARLQVPVLLVASRADEQIGAHHAERLRAILAGNPGAEFHFLDRGRHGDTGPGFERRLVEFFRAHLLPAGGP